jgi:hypothetical protein
MNPVNPLDQIRASLTAANAATAAAEALPECSQTRAPSPQRHGTAVPLPPSLEHKETTAIIDFEKWMAEKGSKEDYFREPIFDETSASSRFRHASWWRIRRSVWASLVRTGQPAARRGAFGSCGSCSWVERSTECLTDFRIRHNHCRDRLCTPCANARAAKLAARLFELARGKKPLFITLTLLGKNEPLASLLDRLYKSFKVLRQMPLWADNIRGGAAFLEIKWSDSQKRWHPHLHVIADGRYIEQGFLTQNWHSITGDSYIVDVRRPPDEAKITKYVTKYASKPLNPTFMRSEKLLDEALVALKGRRLAFAFGEWYGTPLGEIDDDELFDDDSPKYEFFSSLEDVLDAANRGSTESQSILRLCNAETMWRVALLMDTS